MRALGSRFFATYLNAFVGFLFFNPRDKFMEFRVIFELFQGVELLGEVFVFK